jgi:hypothetical protein
MSTVRFTAGYVPGISHEELAWHTLEYRENDSRLEVKVPILTQAQMLTVTQNVKNACNAQIKTMDVSEIVRVIDQAILRLLDVNNEDRKRIDTLLPIATGMDATMLRLNFSQYLQTFRALQLHRFIAEDFSNPKMLDEFQPRITGGWTKAVGAELITHIWAGNVPGLPLWSLISGLLVKSGTIGKVSSAEPICASIFAKVLVDIEPRLAGCLSIIWWPNEDMNTAIHLFQQSDIVLAYGGNMALAAVQAQVPVTTRFLPHGHKLSFGMVSAFALSVVRAKRLAAQAALDIVRYEQQGCYSPQMFYVERGAQVSPQEFAQTLCGEMATLAHKYPRTSLSIEEALHIASWRELHEFAMLQSPAVKVLGDKKDAFVVVYSDVPVSLNPSPLNRCVTVVAVDSLLDVMPLLKDQRSYLQTVGLATDPETLLALGDALAQAGVTRICAIGEMTSPAAGWHHDGRFSLADLVNMVDIEASTEVTANQLTDYEL